MFIWLLTFVLMFVIFLIYHPNSDKMFGNQYVLSSNTVECVPAGHRDIQGLRACCRKHGQASSRFDYVPKAARNCNWTALWKVWWEVCDLWFLCASLHTCASLRWMQLWILSGSMCHLWRSWNLRCLLLQRVYTTREG